jgi:hypothetical protein
MIFPFRFLFPLCIFSVVIMSCEYQLDSNNYRNLLKPDSTFSIQVEITPEEFPKVLDTSFWMHYKFYPQRLSLLDMRVLVDGNYLLFESTEVEDSFQVTPFDFEIGNRKLTIEFITDTKSKSLADLTGYEALVFQRDWEFYKPYICYSGLCINKIINDDGMLKITWDTISLPGFKKYKIYKMFQFFDSPQFIGEIVNRNQTEFYDTEYFGGTATYFMEAELENRTLYSTSISVPYRFPSLNLMWIKDNVIKMYWWKSVFNKVALGYELSYSLNDSDTARTVIFTTDNLMDTTFQFEGKHTNDIIKYTLRIKVRGPEPGQYMWSEFKTSGPLNYLPLNYLKK